MIEFKMITLGEKFIQMIHSIQKQSIQEVSERKKLTYKLEFELKSLPSKINNKEKEIELFTKKLSDPEFYKSDSEAFIAMTEDLESAKKDLEIVYKQFYNHNCFAVVALHNFFIFIPYDFTLLSFNRYRIWIYC